MDFSGCARRADRHHRETSGAGAAGAGGHRAERVAQAESRRAAQEALQARERRSARLGPARPGRQHARAHRGRGARGTGRRRPLRPRRRRRQHPRMPGSTRSGRARSAAAPKPAASLVPEETRKDFIAVLRKMISAEDAKERFAALQSLAVLGDTEIAFPGIEEMVAKDPALASEAVGIVPLLEWEKRKADVRYPAPAAADGRGLGRRFSPPSSPRRRRARRTMLWEVFANDPHVIVCPDSVLQAVVEFYGLQGGLWYADRLRKGIRPGARAAWRRARRRSSPRRMSAAGSWA